MKKRILKYLLILSSILCYYDSLAQTDFRPGYIITNQKDTITGYIDYRGDIRNCRICEFKPNNNSEAIKYLPREIDSYRFDNSKYYISKEIIRDSVLTEVFIEYIVDGIIDLYYYAGNSGTFYLIEQENGKLAKLNVEVKSDIKVENKGGKYIFKFKRYIGVLKAAFKECPEIIPEIDKTNLTHKSLSAITKKYHDYVCDGEECIMYTKKLPLLKARLDVSAGMNISSISISKGTIYSNNYDNSLNPSLSVAADLKIPRFNEKLSVLLLSQFEILNFQSYDKFEEILGYSLQTKNITAYPLSFYGTIKYTYPTGKFRPFIFIGGGFSNLLNLKTTIRTEKVIEPNVETSYTDKKAVENLLPGFISSIGCIWYKDSKEIVNLKFEFKIHAENSPHSKFNIKSFGLKAGYYL